MGGQCIEGWNRENSDEASDHFSVVVGRRRSLKHD